MRIYTVYACVRVYVYELAFMSGPTRCTWVFVTETELRSCCVWFNIMVKFFMLSPR